MKQFQALFIYGIMVDIFELVSETFCMTANVDIVLQTVKKADIGFDSVYTV